MINLVLNLNQNTNIIIWIKKDYKNINIFIYNQSKKYKLCVNKNSFKFDKNTNSIILKRSLLSNKNNYILNLYKFFLKSWNIYFFKKIKFKGKGFRMRFLKKNKFVKFFFGKSHKTFIFFKKIIMKKINKYKFILKHLNKKRLNANAKYPINIKPLNLYTLRGIRASKQIVFKRKGKKGTYI